MDKPVSTATGTELAAETAARIEAVAEVDGDLNYHYGDGYAHKDLFDEKASYAIVQAETSARKEADTTLQTQIADKMNKTGTGGLIDEDITLATKNKLLLKSDTYSSGMTGAKTELTLEPRTIKVQQFTADSIMTPLEITDKNVKADVLSIDLRAKDKLSLRTEKDVAITSSTDMLLTTDTFNCQCGKGGISGTDITLSTKDMNGPKINLNTTNLQATLKKNVGDGSDVYVPTVENSITTKKYVDDLVETKQHKPPILTQKVDTPIWTIQPTITEPLNETFKKWDFDYYFVTLKDTSGTALPAGQFKLMATRDGYQSAIPQVFKLANLNTGNSGALTENRIVDFKEIGSGWKLRNGSVTSFSFALPANLRHTNIEISAVNKVINNTFSYCTISPFNGSANKLHYRMFAGVNNGSYYTADVGFMFNAGSVAVKKYMYVIEKFQLIRHTQYLQASHRRLNVSHDGNFNAPVNVSYSTSVANNGFMQSDDLTNFPVDIDWTNIKIHHNDTTYLNGSEITLKEMI